MSEAAPAKLLKCAFCGQSSEQVERLFAAPDVAICDGCIRSLAAADSVDLPRSKGSTNQLLGRWIKRDEGVSVSLQFTKDDLLFSTVAENGAATSKLLRYSLDGENLSTVELVAMGDRSTDILRIDGDVLTIETKRGISVFDREKSDI